MRNTEDVTCGKPIADWSQSISSVNAVNPSATYYDINSHLITIKKVENYKMSHTFLFIDTSHDKSRDFNLVSLTS
jgi:hypothetical protein